MTDNDDMIATLLELKTRVAELERSLTAPRTLELVADDSDEDARDWNSPSVSKVELLEWMGKITRQISGGKVSATDVVGDFVVYFEI